MRKINHRYPRRFINLVQQILQSTLGEETDLCDLLLDPDTQRTLTLCYATEITWKCPACGELSDKRVKSNRPGFCLLEVERLGPQLCIKCECPVPMTPITGEELMVINARKITEDYAEYDRQLAADSHRPYIIQYRRKR
ncbi:MAG: hypothetical protein UY48_C0008G0018 [Candidatus Gottesmanbacteria bacterium GW2011_GWB1_49_7]|uniref:Uncharacterized protein n=1 Tax=Candidatus Gottesmanbacteria bacterium GW2011_GWB1_49_7 TaxID=1618448 RepID=A0A0G1W2A4_9BACT|nr:MAG: hypothetical protein UY48_C0008G0018 [Candidatus Gottesmanbacteria bacterium GW2011_GWB1_49_7]